MDPDERSDLAALPPQDPRGKRLRRWIPLTLLLAGLAVMGLLIRFVLEESPRLEPKKSPAASATGTNTNHIPSALSDLSEAAKQREVSTLRPGPSAREQELARELADLRTRMNAMEAPAKVAPASESPPVPPAPKPTPQPDADAKRRAAEEAKAAKELARKQREDDAAAKRGRLIWERKSDASAVGAVKTVSSPYSLMPNWVIPCALRQAVSSRVAGPVSAKVTQNIYDSQTGQYLLIPQGAELVGQSSGGTVFGDDTLKVSINKMVVGNQIYTMGNSGLQDVTGQSGLKDQVETFWTRAMLSVVLTGILRGSTTATRAGTDSIPAQIGSTVAQNSAAEGAKQMQQMINISPRLTVRQGFHCLLTVTDSISFTKPYTPIDAQREAYRAKNGW